MLRNVKEYIKDNEFRLTLFSDRIHVVNYDEIVSLEDERISLVAGNERIVIKGKRLLLSKLLDQEALISGQVFSIEVNYHG